MFESFHTMVHSLQGNCLLYCYSKQYIFIIIIQRLDKKLSFKLDSCVWVWCIILITSMVKKKLTSKASYSIFFYISLKS